MMGAERLTEVVAAEISLATGVPPVGVAVGAPGAEGACVSTVRFTAVDAAVLVPPSDCDEATLHAPSESAGSEHPPVDAVATKVHVSV